jgi:type IV pilus assembly protein PilM
VLREHPSVFFTAFGLALQGLGLAKADVNLMPQPKGLLSRIAPLARGLSSVHDAWGIDLGSSCLKAVRLQRDKKTQAIRITEAIVEPHDASWSGGVDEAGFQPVAAATMERFLEQVEGKNVPAVLGFAGFKALGRWFELPPMKDSKLSEAVAYEAKMQIPIPIDDIVYDWQSGPPSESSGGQLPVTLLAARRDHLETWAALFQSPAIKPVAIQSTCLALYNAGQYVAGLGEKEAQSEVKSAATAASPAAPLQAWLEVGAETSNLVVGSSTHVRFRSLGLGSRKLERAVASALKKDHVASRAALRYPAEDPAYHSITEAALPAIEDLVQQVRRSLRSFAGDGLRAASLSVAGGGALQLGVLRRLVHGD